MSDNEPSFSFDDFKRWMRHQKENHFEESSYRKNPLIGATIEPKITAKKLVLKMEVEDGDAHDLALEFQHNGGTIKDVDGKYVLVEVACGSFYIQRHYVERS